MIFEVGIFYVFMKTGVIIKNDTVINNKLKTISLKQYLSNFSDYIRDRNVKNRNLKKIY